MPIQTDQHDKHEQQDKDGPDKRAERRLLWIGISLGISIVVAVGMWILAIVAGSGQLGVSDRTADLLTGAAATVTIVAGQLVLDYRRQVQAATYTAVIGRQDEMGRAITALTEMVTEQHRETLATVRDIANETVARASSVRDLTERIDAGPPDVAPPTPIRPRNGTWHDAAP